MYSMAPDRWDDPALASINEYMIAKMFADEWLIHRTNLEFTILQPGQLQEITGSGKVSLNVQQVKPNSIDNVANLLAHLLTASHSIGQVIEMSDGDIPIDRAVANLLSNR